MSRFYASDDGQAKTKATRRGGPKSGIHGHIRGWHLGVEVSGYPSIEGSDLDSFNVYVTNGSADTTGKLLIVINERPDAEPEIKIQKQ